MFHTKQSRVDTSTKESLLFDLARRRTGLDLCLNYIRKRYEKDYAKRLGEMAGQERHVLMEKLVTGLIKTKSDVSFSKLMRKGLTKGVLRLKITDASSLGFSQLHQQLLDRDIVVPGRVVKLRVLYSGVDTDGDVVWNGGNVLRTRTRPLEQLLREIGELGVWNEIKDLYTRRRCHDYRSDVSNRHGHCNGKPSYFAFGYSSLDEFVQTETPESWEEYQKEHRVCCGVRDFVSQHNATLLCS